MADNRQDNAGIIAPPPLIYIGPLILGLLLNRVFPIKLKILPRAASLVLGGSLIASAVLIVRSGFQTMRRAGTELNASKPTTAIVTAGPYRYTRNPLYLSFALFYGGVAIIANALWAMLLLPVVLFVIRRGVIDREERYLEQKFGEEYLRYKAKVRRWL
jgi:protein-S-isoprenylcysteine O-methyltransferase Ste14